MSAAQTFSNTRRGRTRRGLLGGATALAGLGALGALAGLAGCAQNGAAGAGGQSGGAPASITFMSRDSGSDLEPYKQGIARFNEQQSRVKVAHDIVTGAFEQKLQTVVAGGTPPDVTYMHSQNIPTFAVAGVTGPLDTFVRRDKAAMDGLLPAAVESYRWKGALHGVPDVATSLVMFVNRGLFEKAGVPLPGEKWTWAEYLSAAQRLTNAGRDQGTFGAVDFNGGFPRFTVLWQNDADLLNKDRTELTIDRPEAVEALSWIADQMLRARVHASPADLEGRGAETFFLEGKAAMIPIISSRMGTVAKGAQFDVEVVHLPQGKRRVTRAACGGVAMYRDTRAPEACWELLKYWSTEDFQWLISRAGGIIFPAHKKVVDSPELFAGGPFPRQPRVTVDAMAYARTEPYTVRYTDLVAAWNKEMDSVWKGESAVKDALTRARAAMDPVLQDALAQSKAQSK
jgi:multiple sugar transport system substrate-binding protein